jgi:uncharacterized protein (DUF433 family)
VRWLALRNVMSKSVRSTREWLLGLLTAGDSPETVLQGYPWLEPEDIRACLVYAHRVIAHETIEPRIAGTSA